MNIDLLAFDGDSSLKATDDEGGIEGPCAPFGDADRSRLRDIFLPTTNFGRALKHGADLRHHHGLPMVGDKPNTLADVTLGEAHFEVRPEGLWMKSRMDLSTDAARAVFAEIKAGKYGLSTGSANHLVRRQPLGDGTHEIKTWPIVEVSLTPTPAHPRTGVYAIKSLIEQDEPEAVPASLIERLRASVADLAEMKALVSDAKASRGQRGLSSAKREAVEDLADALKAASDDWNDLAKPAAAVPPPVVEQVAPTPDPDALAAEAAAQFAQFQAHLARSNGVAI